MRTSELPRSVPLVVLFAALVALATGAGHAQERKQALDFSVPSGMVRRDFPLGVADLGVVEQLCRETLSDEGKFHILRSQRVLRVIGRPGSVEAIRQMLPHISQPAPNVRIEFTSRQISNSPIRGYQVRGTARGGRERVYGQLNVPGRTGVFRRNIGGGDRGDLTRNIPPGGFQVFDSGGGGSIEVDLLNRNSGGSSLNKQFILIRSGYEGFIEVARDIPMIDEFTSLMVSGTGGAVLGQNPQLLGNNVILPLTAGTFEAPEIRWEKAGSRLVVQPTVEGELIHLNIMPQISDVVIVDPDALRRRGLNTYLTGREQYVTFTRLNTSVTVRSGQEVVIGGFQKATPSFNRYFWGSTTSGGMSQGTLSVRATIQ